MQRAARKPRAGRPYAIKVTPDKNLKIGSVEVEAERVIAALRSAGLL